MPGNAPVPQCAYVWMMPICKQQYRNYLYWKCPPGEGGEAPVIPYKYSHLPIIPSLLVKKMKAVASKAN